MGEYRLLARHADGREELLHDWNDNLITNNGLDAMFIGGTSQTSHWKRYCVAGTGHTPPTPTDTTLEAPIVGAFGSGSLVPEEYGVLPAVDWDDLPEPPYPPYSWYSVFKYTFAIDAVSEVGEIGIGEFTSGVNLASRCILTDSGGVPVTVVVPTGAALVVHWRLRFFPVLDDQVTVESIGGSDYTLTTRPIVYSQPTFGEQSQGAPFRVDTSTTAMYKVALFAEGASSSYEKRHVIATASASTIFTYISETDLSYYGQEVATYHWEDYTVGDYYRDCYIGVEVAYDYNVNTIMLQTSAGRWYTSISPTLFRPDYVQLNIRFRLSLARYTGPLP